MDNYLHFWRYRLENDVNFDYTPDSLVLHFALINQGTNEIYSEWLFFPTYKELLGFIQYIVLPSAYYSRLFEEEKGTIFIEADSYDNVIELLSKNTYEVGKDLIENFKEMYKELKSIDMLEFSIEKCNDFCIKYNAEFEYHNIVFSNIYIYKNIKSAGLHLIHEYEKQDMIDELERQMEMSKDQMVDMFTNINENPFMGRKIKTFLDNKMLI